MATIVNGRTNSKLSKRQNEQENIIRIVIGHIIDVVVVDDGGVDGSVHVYYAAR